MENNSQNRQAPLRRDLRRRDLQSRKASGRYIARAAARHSRLGSSVDREVEITLNDEVAIRHRQVFDHDMRFPRDILAWIAQGGGPPPQFHFSHIFRVVQITVAVASMTMIRTIHKTTALVAASPTAAALR